MNSNESLLPLSPQPKTLRWLVSNKHRADLWPRRAPLDVLTLQHYCQAHFRRHRSPTASSPMPSSPDLPLSWASYQRNDLLLGPSSLACIQNLRGRVQRPVAEVLEMLCTRFSIWLESRATCEQDRVLSAVERDGSRFFNLARSTLAYEDALQGVVRHTKSDVDGEIGEHARTLRDFARFLESKILAGNLSLQLEQAILRDGEPLFKLAVCCLDFDQAIRGAGSWFE